MKKFFTVLALSAFVLLAVAPFASAQTGPVPPSVPGDVSANNISIYTILNNIITIAFVVLMLLAVLMIIWAAFNYLTAQGNPEKVETAQRMLLYAIIAIVIGLLARSVPWIISKFVQTNVATGY